MLMTIIMSTAQCIQSLAIIDTYTNTTTTVHSQMIRINTIKYAVEIEFENEMAKIPSNQ